MSAQSFVYCNIFELVQRMPHAGGNDNQSEKDFCSSQWCTLNICHLHHALAGSKRDRERSASHGGLMEDGHLATSLYYGCHGIYL